MAGVLLAGAAAAAGAAGSFRRDLRRSYEHLEHLDRHVVRTELGHQEFAEAGSGPPLLVSHGVFHGCDGGLLSVRDLVEGRRVIAPSRFGYLGSDLPPHATAAMQADAVAALLDHLGLDTVDVIGISAGTSAAAQFALRHPGRIDHLVISSGSFPGSPTAEAPPGWAKVFYSDRAMWALKVFARPAFARLMGIPPGFPRDAAEARVVDELLASIFPVDLRAEGAVFDAYRSKPEIASFPSEDLRVSTLIVHARDDPLASYTAAAEAAARIPTAVLVTLDSGGHLQLGQSARVRAEISSFLAAHE